MDEGFLKQVQPKYVTCAKCGTVDITQPQHYGRYVLGTLAIMKCTSCPDGCATMCVKCCPTHHHGMPLKSYAYPKAK